MNATEEKYASQIADIVRAARKYRGMTQIDTCKLIGVTQGTLSKIEKGELVLSAPVWFEFCEQMKISPRSFLLGYIDEPTPESIQIDSQYESNFALPKQYQFSRGSSVRSTRSLVLYAEKTWGRKKLLAYLEHKKVDADFFRVLPNQINLQFTYDLMSALESKGTTYRKADLRQMMNPFSDPSFHGNMASILSDFSSVPKYLSSFIKKIDRYQANFQYEISGQNNETQIVGRPAPFLAAFSATNDIQKQLCQIKSEFLSTILRTSGSHATVKHTHCFYSGDQSCNYQILAH